MKLIILLNHTKWSKQRPNLRWTILLWAAISSTWWSVNWKTINNWTNRQWLILWTIYNSKTVFYNYNCSLKHWSHTMVSMTLEPVLINFYLKSLWLNEVRPWPNSCTSKYILFFLLLSSITISLYCEDQRFKLHLTFWIIFLLAFAIAPWTSAPALVEEEIKVVHDEQVWRIKILDSKQAGSFWEVLNAWALTRLLSYLHSN